MSSFNKPHKFFLFEMKNGKQKLAYGVSSEDALAILRLRLSDEEMNQILPDQITTVSQRNLRNHIHNLG